MGVWVWYTQDSVFQALTSSLAPLESVWQNLYHTKPGLPHKETPHTRPLDFSRPWGYGFYSHHANSLNSCSRASGLWILTLGAKVRPDRGVPGISGPQGFQELKPHLEITGQGNNEKWEIEAFASPLETWFYRRDGEFLMICYQTHTRKSNPSALEVRIRFSVLSTFVPANSLCPRRHSVLCGLLAPWQLVSMVSEWKQRKGSVGIHGQWVGAKERDQMSR